jgi:hypothetical protein
MTVQSSVRRGSKLMTLASSLCVLSFTATACGSPDGAGAGVDAGAGVVAGVDAGVDAGAGVDVGAGVDIGARADDATEIVAEVAAPPTHATSESPGALQYGDPITDLLSSPAAGAEASAPTVAGFRAVEWDDLIAPGLSGEEIYERYREQIEAVKPGSPELDEIYAEMIDEYDAASVNPDLNSQKIQLAGFVAPLTFDGEKITEFLLVPYFGACIHVPPPPLNQVVVITLAEGDSLSLEESWGAVWVAGTLDAGVADTALASAGCSIAGPVFGTYTTQ